MSRADTWMPLYIGDYLADTRQLTTVEHGAYLLLLMEQWRRGWLPDDDEKLARITGMRLNQWRKAAGNLRPFFDAGEIPGTIRQKRLHAEREKALEICAKRADAARSKHEQERGGGGGKPPLREQNSVRVTEPDLGPKPLKNGKVEAANAEQMQSNLRVPSHSPRQEERKNPQPATQSAPKGARLDAGWQPSDDDRKFATGLGLNPDTVAAEFRDYWCAETGAKARKLDWAATFRNRCRQVAERKRRAGPAHRNGMAQVLVELQEARRAGVEADLGPATNRFLTYTPGSGRA